MSFVVALLTIIQVRFSPQFQTSLGSVFHLLLFVVVMGGIYSALRVALYGTLSGVIMHAGISNYRTALSAFGEESRDWTFLTKATMFSEWHLKNNTLKKNRLRLALIQTSGMTRILVSAFYSALIVYLLTLLGV